MTERGHAPDGAGEWRPAFSCALTAVLIARVKRVAGDAGPGRLLNAAASRRTLQYLLDIGNWVTYEEAIALLEAGTALTGDPAFARGVGGDFVSALAGSANSSVLRSLGSPEELLRKITLAGNRFSTGAVLTAVEVSPGFAEIHAVGAEGVPRHRLHCEWTAGLLTQVTVLFGMAPAVVTHTSCQTEGAPYCRYIVEWDTGQASDAAGELVTLRRQLAAMSARLQSVFDTAADLIGSDDLAGTLARITERAAQQVRAPRFLLAVRPTPDACLQFHQKGFEQAEARAVAERVVAHEGGGHPEHWLIAPVRSHRHDYGALAAVQDPGGGFFDHERELLQVYARYAATALDSATALAEAKARHDEAQRRHEEAQRRYEESSTLLELARRLARAGSSEQVARQLADAVPGVVDCDRVSVYVWRPEVGELVREAINATDRGGDAEVGLRRVSPAAVPQLASWLDRPSPELLFIDVESSPVKDSLREFGAVAAVAVPIATDERFLGCIVASVVERPQRLAPSPELVDRLSGVAAHAVTALENGRLVDHITHQARRDDLTGAANRVGFHERLSAAAARADGDGTALALFYIDLDDFKPINDDHGHEVGDELLRAVSARLAECVRGGDTVARLGGDEFAVLVEDIADDAQLDAISDRLARAFLAPLQAAGRSFRVSASIGRAVSGRGEESPQALLRCADAAMYDVKRRTRRRDAAAGERAG